MKRKGNDSRKFVNQRHGPSITALLLEVVTVIRSSPLGRLHKSIAGARMVIVNLENLLNEVSPKVTPFSLDQVRTLCTDFTFLIQQSYRPSIQPRDGARRSRQH